MKIKYKSKNIILVTIQKQIINRKMTKFTFQIYFQKEIGFLGKIRIYLIDFFFFLSNFIFT